MTVKPTPYGELVTQHGQQRIVDQLSAHVLLGRLDGRGARALVESRNWQGAMVVLRWLNGLDKHGKMSA